MRKCPNCGQGTARTKDWACPWCGYPLLSKSYKEIPKAYRELQEEKRLSQKMPLRGQVGASILLSYSTSPPTYTPESESELMPESEITPESEPMPEGEPEPILKPESELMSEREPEPILKRERGLMVPPLDLTVEELYSLFAMKSIKVTGVVDKIVLDDNYNVYYVILTTAETTENLYVQCMFHKETVPELNELANGQIVTVEGKYAGYIVNMLMRDCILVD